jgi:cytochrome c553
MRSFWTVPVGVVAMLALTAAAASAKPEYTRKTTKACAFCHQPPGYNLNGAGKYYAEHNHSLKGYTAPKPKPSH